MVTLEGFVTYVKLCAFRVQAEEVDDGVADRKQKWVEWEALNL